MNKMVENFVKIRMGKNIYQKLIENILIMPSTIEIMYILNKNMCE